MFDHVEAYGAERFTSGKLNALVEQCRKALEYERAIKAALLNWTTGIAQWLIRCDIDNGFDALSNLCNRYIPWRKTCNNMN